MSIEYDPFDPAQVDDHQATLARLRADAPVSEVVPGVWYLARHGDIVDVCRRPGEIRQGRFTPREVDTRTPDQLNLGETDPPEHTQVRKILASLLSPPRVREMTPLVERVCTDLVGGFAGRGHADLIADLGAPLPGAVIGPLTGLPAVYHDRLRSYADAYMRRTDPDPEVAAAAAAEVTELDEVALELIRERRASGDRPDDVLSGLLEGRDANGDELSEDKIMVHLTKDMIVGGTETTTHLIGNLFFHLCATDNYQRVRGDRGLVPAAIEETLRFAGPVQLLFRDPAVDTTIGGCPVPAGSVVALGYASANRDEDVFDDPDTFSLDRGDDLRRQHFGFGYGIHLCVGAALARLEATSALNAVLDRIPDMALAPDFTYPRVPFFMMRGPERVDVVFTPST